MDAESRFLEWLECCGFWVGYCRYGQLGGYGFVCVASFDNDYRETVEDLSCGDVEAIDAGVKLAASTDTFIGKDDNPAKAMQQCVDKLREHYKTICAA